MKVRRAVLAVTLASASVAVVYAVVPTPTCVSSLPATYTYSASANTASAGLSPPYGAVDDAKRDPPVSTDALPERVSPRSAARRAARRALGRMTSAPAVIDLLGGSDDDDNDGPRSARAASGRAASGSTPERRALAQPTAPQHTRRRDAPETRRGGGAAGADAAQGPVLIDLTGDDDEAVNAAFRAWEVIDLTGDDCAAGAPAQQAAAPADVLARQRARIAAFLRSSHCKALRVQRCDANPHAAPGRPLYERFAAALERVDDKRVELCFHGTPEVNVDSILRDGLDPKLRRGQALGKGGAPCSLLLLRDPTEPSR